MRLPSPVPMRFRSPLAHALALALVLACAWLPACSTTRFHQRARLADRCMRYDSDAATAFLRTKAEGAREGSFGGFGMSPAGGCGCE